MLEVVFYTPEQVPDSLLAFAVIAATYEGQWVFCRHRQRETWEIPGGHREQGETIQEAARRELYEETGATDAQLTPVCVYGVKQETESYGMLFYAEIKVLGELPDLEIGRIACFADMPQALTYPLIQPKLMAQVKGALGLISEE